MRWRTIAIHSGLLGGIGLVANRFGQASEFFEIALVVIIGGFHPGVEFLPGDPRYRGLQGGFGQGGKVQTLGGPVSDYLPTAPTPRGGTRPATQ